MLRHLLAKMITIFLTDRRERAARSAPYCQSIAANANQIAIENWCQLQRFLYFH